MILLLLLSTVAGNNCQETPPGLQKKGRLDNYVDYAIASLVDIQDEICKLAKDDHDDFILACETSKELMKLGERFEDLSKYYYANYTVQKKDV